MSENRNITVVPVNDHVWLLDDSREAACYVVAGQKRAAVIDTSVGFADIRKTARSLTSLPLILINTHADPDHISGNSAFEEFYMSPAEEENYKNFNGKGTILVVKEGDIIDLGDRALRIIDRVIHRAASRSSMRRTAS